MSQSKDGMNRKEKQISQHSDNAVIIQHRMAPDLIRVMADNQDKRSMGIFWGVFIGIIILAAILTAALPPATEEKTLNDQTIGTYLQQCEYPNTFDSDNILRCGTFNASNNASTLAAAYLVNGIGPQNQFQFFTLQIIVKNISNPLNIQQNIRYLYYALSQQNTTNGSSPLFKHNYLDTNGTTLLSIKSGSNPTIYDQNRRPIGYEASNLLIDRYIDNNYYALVIEFDSQHRNQFDNVEKVTWRILRITGRFTAFSIVIRIVFFIIMLASAIRYLIWLLKVPREERIIEQKMIMMLAVLSVCFNDPWYAATVLKPNGLSNFLSVLLVVNFIIFVILLWIIFFDRIHKEDGRKETNVLRWYKFAYCLILYILTLVLYLNYAYNHFESSPVLPSHDITTGKFLALEVLTIIVLAVGIIYIFVRYIMICASIETKIWRNQLFVYFSLFFIIIMTVMFFVGGLHIYDYEPSRVLFFYTGMNLYSFYLQRMYTITSEELEKLEEGYFQGEQMMNFQYPAEGGVYLNFDNLNRPHTGLLNSPKDEFQDQQVEVPSMDPYPQTNGRNRNNINYLRQHKQQEKIKQPRMQVKQEEPKVDFFPEEEQKGQNLKKERSHESSGDRKDDDEGEQGFAKFQIE